MQFQWCKASAAEVWNRTSAFQYLDQYFYRSSLGQCHRLNLLIFRFTTSLGIWDQSWKRCHHRKKFITFSTQIQDLFQKLQREVAQHLCIHFFWGVLRWGFCGLQWDGRSQRRPKCSFPWCYVTRKTAWLIICRASGMGLRFCGLICFWLLELPSQEIGSLFWESQNKVGCLEGDCLLKSGRWLWCKVYAFYQIEISFYNHAYYLSNLLLAQLKIY